MVTEECYKCKWRGTLGGIESDFCCDYCWVTGNVRIAMEKREDGLCPAYEEGDPVRLEVRPLDQPIRTVVIKGRGYTHAELMEMYGKGMTDAEIAREIGGVKSTVFQWRHRNNLPPNQRKQEFKSKYDYAEFRRLWDKGLNDSKIAKAVGCAMSTVNRWRMLEGLASNGVSGSEPRIDRKKMRELYDTGLSDSKIAKEVGCNPSTISKWRIREGLPPNGVKPCRM